MHWGGIQELDVTQNNSVRENARFLTRLPVHILSQISIRLFQWLWRWITKTQDLGKHKHILHTWEQHAPWREPITVLASKPLSIPEQEAWFWSSVGSDHFICWSILFLFSFIYSPVACRFMKKPRNQNKESTSISKHGRISYAELLWATSGTENLTGSGSFARVYKCVQEMKEWRFLLSRYWTFNSNVHARVLWAECEALRNIRHQNLIKILTCSSVDSRGKWIQSCGSWVHG